MDNAVVDENVRGKDFSGVNENSAIFNCNRDISAINCLERSVAQAAAISNGSLNHMVLQNRCHLLGGQVSDSGPDSLECGVGR